MDANGSASFGMSVYLSACLRSGCLCYEHQTTVIRQILSENIRDVPRLIQCGVVSSFHGSCVCWF